MAVRRRREDDEAMDDAKDRYPVSVTIPVARGEMDAFQHVNNVVHALVNHDYRAGRTAPVDDALRAAIAALEAESS